MCTSNLLSHCKINYITIYHNQLIDNSVYQSNQTYSLYNSYEMIA